VYDVKPYIPYSDCVPDARPPAGFDVPPRRRPVVFLAEAEAGLERCPGGFRALVEQTLSLDPRPAYRGEDPGRQHGVVLMGINVRFRVIADRVEVVRITPGEHATCS
jgi:hypothetical protein